MRRWGNDCSVASVKENNVCYKRSYPDKLDALLKLDEISRADRRDEKRAYFCYACNAYHLTSRP